MMTKDAVEGARVTWDGRAATIVGFSTSHPKNRVCIRFDDNRAERYVWVEGLSPVPVVTEDDIRRLRNDWVRDLNGGASKVVVAARYKAYCDAVVVHDSSFAVKGIMPCPICRAVGQPQPSHDLESGVPGFRCLSCGKQAPPDAWLP